MICVQTVNYSFAAKEVSISRIQNYKGTMTKTLLDIELETKVRKDFTITKKTPTKAYSWLKYESAYYLFHI